VHHTALRRSQCHEGADYAQANVASLISGVIVVPRILLNSVAGSHVMTKNGSKSPLSKLSVSADPLEMKLVTNLIPNAGYPVVEGRHCRSDRPRQRDVATRRLHVRIVDVSN
jgi:hypothetical protein